ncbi:MAG: TIGR03960 family B12-binding radical SAM protein [Treponema sp.]|nr:TIGR03960 family B12-binding radical SAM protein [Treponema sp.]
MDCILPLELFGSELCSVQNPAAYIGGEIGQIVKPHSENDGLFNFAIAFPDVYTIGMSNQAIKIIYNGLNAMDCVRCERVFAVESDFENLLKKHDVPLYTLETGMPLSQLDMIGFSIGYELGITGALSILDAGRVPLLKKDRSDTDPIVISGGVGATNPAPFSAFFDATFIGEAEGGMFELVAHIAHLKKAGATRKEILREIAKNPHVWTEDMSVEKCGHDVARRAVYNEFGREKSVESFYPLPNIKTVQNHGVVEIMRGCPNGCRFCHAGIYYRPQRAKTRKLIFEEVENLVNKAGYKEISLTSLSSADYPGIGRLLSELNEKYTGQNISFQLPSLKVNSFTFPILEQLSEVRKSGLTFAVETPEEAWQLRLNKEVYAQHLVDLILEAKKRGWNKAKFYFMVGLPFPETEEKTEEQVIVDFLLDLQEKTHIQCNVNVGTFIPKPHTPYQWVRQISPEESEKKLRFIREHLPKGRFKVGTHETSTSYLEGLFSRGDARAGDVIYAAFKKGCRLDAWENHLRENIPLWEQSFSEAGWDVKKEILRARSVDESLPWDSVSLGPAKNFFKKEWEKNLSEELTPVCSPECNHRCGVCGKNTIVNVQVEEQGALPKQEANDAHDSRAKSREQNIPILYRVIFSFSKMNGGEFFSHLAQIELFNRAITQSRIPALYTAGFNPLPRLEFGSTLSLGIKSQDEIASMVLFQRVSEDEFAARLNQFLPASIRIQRVFIFPVTNKRKRESLSSALWGNAYEYVFKDGLSPQDFFDSPLAADFTNPDSQCSFSLAPDSGTLKATLAFHSDRPFRNALESFFSRKIWEIVEIKKTKTLAKSQTGIVDYFSLYKKIAEENESLIRAQIDDGTNHD